MGDGRVPRRTQSRRRGRSSDETRSGEWDEYQVQRAPRPPRSTRRVNPAAAASSPRRLCEPSRGSRFLHAASLAPRRGGHLLVRPPAFPLASALLPRLEPGFRFTNTSSAPLRDGSRSESRRRFASPSARAFSFSRSSRLGAGAPPPPLHPPPQFRNQRLATRASPTRRRAPLRLRARFRARRRRFRLPLSRRGVHHVSLRRRRLTRGVRRGGASPLSSPSSLAASSPRSRPLSANTAAAIFDGRALGIVAMHVNLPPPIASARGWSLAASTPNPRRRRAPPTDRSEIPQTNSALADALTRCAGSPRGRPSRRRRRGPRRGPRGP